MAETRFSDIGRVEAIRQLYDDTPYKPFVPSSLEAAAKDTILQASKVLLEGIDFDLVYFPLKHLGYKSVVEATGELYAQMARPEALSVVLGLSAKLDFADAKEIWSGIVAAAHEHGYQKVDLDLIPSRNGLTVSISALGRTSALTRGRRPSPKTKDLICVSGSLGAAYLGMSVLEREKAAFEKGETEHPSLETYKMLVGSYLKPDLPAGIVASLEDSEIYPSAGYFITRGLSDALKRLSRETGLGAKVYADKIPFEGNSFQLGKEMDIDPVSAAMNGGDDCRLLFTVPILSMEKFRHDFQTFDIIGHLALPDVGTVLVTPDGLEMPAKAQGWNEQ